MTSVPTAKNPRTIFQLTGRDEEYTHSYLLMVSLAILVCCNARTGNIWADLELMASRTFKQWNNLLQLNKNKLDNETKWEKNMKNKNQLQAPRQPFAAIWAMINSSQSKYLPCRASCAGRPRGASPKSAPRARCRAKLSSRTLGTFCSVCDDLNHITVKVIWYVILRVNQLCIHPSSRIKSPRKKKCIIFLASFFCSYVVLVCSSLRSRQD